MLESFLEIYKRDKDPRWKETVSRCLVHLHDTMRDENGRYPHRWDRRRPGPMQEVVLLNQASPARIYWLAAQEMGKPLEEQKEAEKIGK